MRLHTHTCNTQKRVSQTTDELTYIQNMCASMDQKKKKKKKREEWKDPLWECPSHTHLIPFPL